MLFVLYDCLQIPIFCAIVVRLFLAWIGRKSCRRLLAYLGSEPITLPPQKKGAPCFVFYAVSVGETKAISSLFHLLKQRYPKGIFCVVSRTKTGQEEAKRSLESADGYFFMPLDLSFVMKRFVKSLSPSVVICVESDLWLHFLRFSKKAGASLFLVNGRISSRSYSFFKRVPWFSKQLLSPFDRLFVQNEVFQKRFSALGVDSKKITVTGNIKLEAPTALISSEEKKELQKSLGIDPKDLVVVIASTKEGEEKTLLQQILPLWQTFPTLKVLIAPRHPERFSQVEEELLQMIPSLGVYSRQERLLESRVILIDTMGLVFSLYQLSEVAIVGGSFTRKGRGHNIFEPIQALTPVLFGPYMSSQKDLVSLVLEEKAGAQGSFEEIPLLLSKLLVDSQDMREQAKHLLAKVKGSSLKTLELICQKVSYLVK